IYYCATKLYEPEIDARSSCEQRIGYGLLTATGGTNENSQASSDRATPRAAGRADHFDGLSASKLQPPGQGRHFHGHLDVPDDLGHDHRQYLLYNADDDPDSDFADRVAPNCEASPCPGLAEQSKWVIIRPRRVEPRLARRSAMIRTARRLTRVLAWITVGYV